MARLAPLLLAAVAGLAPSAAAQQPDAAVPETCATLDACLVVIRDRGHRVVHVRSNMDEHILQFGDAAIDALVPMLADPDPEIRERAGYLLSSFRRIDPRHLPTLAHAWRHGDTLNRQGRGNGWLPRAIAATRTDEALRLLWADFERDPEMGSNAQTFFALADMGAERIRPLVRAELRSCATRWGRSCEGVIALFYELDGRFPPPVPRTMPQWAVDELVGLVGAPSAEASEAVVDTLARLRHPSALEPLQRRLADLPTERALAGDGDWNARGLITSLAAYGEAARASGPVIARYLDRRFDPDLRADAALALGQIGDRSSIPALAATAADLGDDWLLAYHVAESLGRLRAEETRTLLEHLQRQHWHRGVRNNAARALNTIAGGPFARADAPGDGAPYPASRDEEGNELLYFGGLRFAGDGPSVCAGDFEERHVDVSRDPIGQIAWPASGGAEMRLEALGERRVRELRRRVPVRQVQGRVQGALPARDGDLIAFNGGEFGGGLFHVPAAGPARPLLGEPVFAAWRMGGRLYVAAGLNHFVLDRGHLYVVDPERLSVERIVRLPASPYRLFATQGRAVIIRTREGDLAVREDGSLADAETIRGCADG